MQEIAKITGIRDRKKSSVDEPMPLPNGTSLENGMYTMLFHTSRPSEDGALTDI